VWVQPFGLFVYVIGRGSLDNTDLRMNRVRADIEKRLGVEVADHGVGPAKLCDGLADDLEIREPQYLWDADRNCPVLWHTVAIRYRVNANNPYLQT